MGDVKLEPGSYTWEKRVLAVWNRVYPVLLVFSVMGEEYLKTLGVPARWVAVIIASIALVLAVAKGFQKDRNV